jgi:hypothetical protein
MELPPRCQTWDVDELRSPASGSCLAGSRGREARGVSGTGSSRVRVVESQTARAVSSEGMRCHMKVRSRSCAEIALFRALMLHRARERNLSDFGMWRVFADYNEVVPITNPRRVVLIVGICRILRIVSAFKVPGLLPRLQWMHDRTLTGSGQSMKSGYRSRTQAGQRPCVTCTP